jgi:hypothetical protein
MDGYIYFGSIVITVLAALMFYKNNNINLMLLMLGIAGYIVYSHETGHTATEFKDSVVNSIDNSAVNLVDSFKNDIDKAAKSKK